MEAITVKDKSTGEIKTAVYAITKSGNKRYHIEGKPMSDKKFDKQFTVCTR